MSKTKKPVRKELIYPVILAGGSGTRLWPRSREKDPKQFIRLIDGKTLFQITCKRFSNKKLFAPLTIVTHEEHRFSVRDQLHEIGIKNATIITEPATKNTLTACLLAAFFLFKKVGNVPILFSPADHFIKDDALLYKVIAKTKKIVTAGNICLFGIPPTHPHTGYGYIVPDKASKGVAVKPLAFVEKPSKKKAMKMISSGAFWNSGIYFSTAETLIKEASLYTPHLHQVFDTKLSIEKNTFGDFYVIDSNMYSPIHAISIDKGIAEKSSKLLLAVTNISWNDLGSWSALYSHFKKDEHGNIIKGDVVSIDTKNSYIESNSRLVATLGLKHIGVIETRDATLIFSLKEGEKVKKIVSELSRKNREEVITNTVVHRPWGTYEILGKSKNYQSKKLVVLPGAGASLQSHAKRAEHWVVVSGTATVTINNKKFQLKENQSTFIPIGAKHRVENNTKKLLTIIEVQTGTYFGEDDIKRYTDKYGRIK